MLEVQNIMETMFSTLRLAKFYLVYEVGNQGLHLPKFKGSMIRGIFGHAFKKVSCTCPSAPNQNEHHHLEDCIYHYIFETKSHKQIPRFGGIEVPRPFVILPPLDEKEEYAPGEKIIFSFTLFGRGIEYLPYFINAFDLMGDLGFGKEKLTVELKQVFFEKFNGIWISIYNSEDRVLNLDFPIYNGNDLFKNVQPRSHNKIEVSYMTPTRIQVKGKYVSEIEFSILIRAIVRRLMALIFYHHDNIFYNNDIFDVDFRIFIEDAKPIVMVKNDSYWFDWERYSNRQNLRMILGGVRGKVEYEGELNKFFPFLKIGEWIHVGKNTVFGLGKFMVTNK